MSGPGALPIPVSMAARVHQRWQTGSTRLLLLVGFAVALIALANVTALSNWHAALFEHDDLSAETTSVGHGHHHHHEADRDHAQPESEAGSANAPSIDLHALTHAMIHGLAGLVPNVTVAFLAHEAASHWFAGRSFALDGISPEALLRPPRS